eukprot:1675409-Rhodomonas_salina.1
MQRGSETGTVTTYTEAGCCVHFFSFLHVCGPEGMRGHNKRTKKAGKKEDRNTAEWVLCAPDGGGKDGAHVGGGLDEAPAEALLGQERHRLVLRQVPHPVLLHRVRAARPR